MIGKLRGRVDAISSEGAIIDVGGVGYDVFCSARTLAGLPPPGGAVELVIETHVREDHIHLYGFPSLLERDMFRTLTTVQGVGAKVAMSITSALSAHDIAEAVVAGDQTVFRRASGVGPKLAQRLITELKDKLPAFGGAALSVPTAGTRIAAPGKVTTAVDDAVSALVNLGYGRMDAFGAVSRAAVDEPKANVARLIKQSLRDLGGRDG
jgi:Holliday junction DNA helicase RuvA